jgi:hypothetical protein
VKGFKGNQLTTEKIKQVNILESLPYEVPQELLERRSTNDDGTDFQRDETNHTSLIIRQKKKPAFFINTILFFSLAAFILITYHQGERDREIQIPFTGVTWLPKLAHLISEHFL